MPSWGYALIAFGVVLLLTVGYHFFLYYICKNRLFQPKKRDFDFLVEYETKEKGFKREWLDIPYKEYRRTSRYGYELFARYYKSDVGDGKKIMISLHGHNSCSVSQFKYLNMFLSLGYDVFIPDHRRSGYSGGDSVTFGACEKYDVIDWIDVLQSEHGDALFAVFGESMGAATAMMVGSLDDRIVYVIEYCGYANFEGLLTRYVGSEALRRMMMPSLSLVAKIGFGIDLRECDALRYVSESTKPILMIHSRADKVVDFKNFIMLSEARRDSDTHVFDDCIHARSMVKHPREFEECVVSFVKENESRL